jgi:hypothetical protein
MRVDTHLMGSDRGYGELAASSGVSQAERTAIAGIDIGLPAGGRSDRLDRQLIVLCRPLPGGRVGLTRCVAGEPDEVGRQTIQFRTILMNRSDWVLEARHALSGMLVMPTIWRDPAFEAGTPMTIAIGSVDGSAPSPVTRALACMVQNGPRPVLLKAETATNATLLSMVGNINDADAAELQWGLGLSRVVSGLDVATVATGAAAVGQALQQIDQSLIEACSENQNPVLPSLRKEPPPSVARRRGLRDVPEQDNTSNRTVVLVAAIGLLFVLGWVAGQWWGGAQTPTDLTAVPAVAPQRPVASKPPPPRVRQPSPRELPALPTPAVDTHETTADPPKQAPPAASSPPPAPPSVIQPAQPMAASARAIRQHVEEPVQAAEILAAVDSRLLSALIPPDQLLGDTLSEAVIKTFAAKVLSPGAAEADPWAYLCLLSTIEGAFESLAMVADAEGLKTWGAPPATARWLSAAGRNEQQIGVRLRQLSRCESLMRRIGRTEDVIRSLVHRPEVEATIARVLREWLAMEYADAMKMEWECLWGAQHLVTYQFSTGGVQQDGIIELRKSRAALIQQRDGTAPTGGP